MVVKKIWHSGQRATQRLPMRFAVIVPFIIQVTVAVGLTGWLSFRSGEEAVSDVANQLQGEVTKRVAATLSSYQNIPHQVNRLNSDQVALGLLNLQDLAAWEKYLWRQVQVFPQINVIALANDQGEYVAATNLGNGNILRAITDRTLESQPLNSYNTDQEGDRTTLVSAAPKYDARTRPWYKTAVQAGRATWTTVYQNVVDNTSQISAVLPLYDRDKKLIGVGATVVRLSYFSEFLQTLRIGKTGQVFIIEPDGNMIATSTTEPLVQKVNNKAERINITASSNPLTQATGKFLQGQSTDFLPKAQSENPELFFNNQPHYVQVTQVKDENGLNWLIVVVVPKADFLGQIIENNQRTVLLCFLALAIAILVGIKTSKWIVDPIKRLSVAANAIAQRNLDQRVPMQGNKEIVNLSISFNSMAEQLQQAFLELEELKNAFARFFPPEYLEFLNKENITHVQLGDNVSKEMAIMFSDIRAFTARNEFMTPQESFDFINSYLQRVTPAIRDHHGVVVKFLGDGIMAVFPNNADDAVLGAIAQFKQIEEYNLELIKAGSSPINVGMGLHLGYMMVGMVGEYNRMQGDAFSDNVNLTARIEGLTKFYGVSLLISEEIYKRLRNFQDYQLRFLDQVVVKGRSEPIAIYEVLDVETEKIRELKLKTLPEFEQGLEYYCQGEIALAETCFRSILSLNPQDKTVQLYLDRLKYLSLEGLPQDWQGVWIFAEK